MMMVKLVFFLFWLLIVVLVSIPLDAQGIGGPVRSQYTGVRIIDEMVAWKTTFDRFVTSSDSIWIHAKLVNVANETIEFNAQDYCKPIKLTLCELTTKQTRTVHLKTQTGLQRFQYNRIAKHHEILHEFRVDIRHFFGKLKPGSYTVRLDWNLADFEMSSSSKQLKRNLESHDLKIVIADCNITQAGQYQRSMRDRMVQCHAVEKVVAFVTQIKNTSDKNIYLPLLHPIGQELNKQPIPIHATLFRWHPLHSQSIDETEPPSGYHDNKRVRPSIQETDAKSSLFLLKPGQSVQLKVPECDGDGFYVLLLKVYNNDEPRTQIEEKLYSNTFQIRTLSGDEKK